MKEEVIINGSKLDLFNGSHLTFEIESNILKKMDDLSCCYSYTLSLPNTTQNKRTFGDLLRVGRSGSKLRPYIPAEYYRDGLLIFSGRCYVDEVTDGEIKVCFKFGINDALQEIKDDKWNINELFNKYDHDDSSTYYTHIYTDDELANYKLNLPMDADKDCELYPFTYSKPTALFMQNWQIDDDYFSSGVITPSVCVKEVLDRIKAKYGTELDIDANPQNSWILTPHKNRFDRFSVVATNTVCEFVSVASDWGGKDETYITPLNSKDIDGRTKITIKTSSSTDQPVYPAPNVLHPYKINAIGYYVSGFPTKAGEVYYSPNYQEGKTGNLAISMFTWEEGDTEKSGIFYPEDHNCKFEFESQQGPVIIIQQDEKNARSSVDSLHFDTIKIIYYCQIADEDCTFGYFNSIDCLPSISITDFLFDYIFGACGRYPVNTMKGGNAIKCVSLEEIYEGKRYDWSDKLITTDLNMYPKLETIARKNYIKFAEEQDVTDTYHTLPCDNDSLEKEDTIAELDFGHYINPNYILKVNGEDYKQPPKMCAIDPNVIINHDGKQYAALKNNFLTWLDTTISGELLKAIYKNPFRLECKLRLTSLDLATLDLSRPVYLEQFGALFFIDKLSVGDTTTDATLIKLT